MRAALALESVPGSQHTSGCGRPPADAPDGCRAGRMAGSRGESTTERLPGDLDEAPGAVTARGGRNGGGGQAMRPWWRLVWDALYADFSDLPDAGQVTHVVVRLLLAAALGGLLGWERERAGKAAGRRTHMLVALGATFFVFVPQQAGMSQADLSRVIQGLVAGIGFIGAGAILKEGEGRRVRGLTTAAGIWLTAAVGVAVGLGREASAVLGA